MNDTEYKELLKQCIQRGVRLDDLMKTDPRFTRYMEEILQEKTAPAQHGVTDTYVQDTRFQALSEQEAISIILKWDEEEDPRSQDEMIEELADINSYREEENEVKPVLTSERLRQLVKAHAKNAPEKTPPTLALPASIDTLPPYPIELDSLVKSGVAYHQDGYWLLHRCNTCGQFKNDCCGQIGVVSAVRFDKTLTGYGRQAVGLEPIKPPKPPKTAGEIQQQKIAQAEKEPWWSEFRGVSELEGTGEVKMYIENFIPEGITLITGLPKEGKSWLALAIVKALTTGEPLFGRVGYEVPEPHPVLYLAAESGDGALKLRCKRFNITDDKTKFLARTLSQGVMFGLDDPKIESVIKAIRPIVVLETLIRFNEGDDEDSASENRKLAQLIFHLLGLGAPAVIGIHHSRKDLDKANPTKEDAVRGSGDGLAMPDAVWLVMQDERLFQGGKGPNEIDVVGWGRDFNPVPIRLALTKKAPADLPPTAKTFAPGIVSILDTTGEFGWVDRAERAQQAKTKREDLAQAVEQLIAHQPSISREDLAKETGATDWDVRKVVEQLGYTRGKGRNKKWQREAEKLPN